MHPLSRLSWLALSVVLLLPAPAVAAPRVVASILPLHSLVAAVMAGVGEPELLVSGAASPHSYALRPSDAARLGRADVLFWIGPELETFLAKPLAALAGGARLVEIAAAPGVTLLASRSGGIWPVNGHPAEEVRHHGGHDHDPHLWLDPDNATAIVRAVAAVLSEVDPGAAARYQANAAATLDRVAALDAELARLLEPVREVPFIVFHDAFQYFEAHYRLNAAGAITIDPERAPGARRVLEIRRRLAAYGAACVFSEPQFEPALVATVTEGSGVESAELDPLGAALAPGPEAWFALMRTLATTLRDCLDGR